MSQVPLPTASSVEDGHGAPRGVEDTEVTLEAMFRVVDVDCSGGLDMEELRGFTRILGTPDMSEEECAGMLREYVESQALEGDSPELNFDGFCQLVEPILVELQEADRRVEEVVAAEMGTDAEGKFPLPPGEFEESALGCVPLNNPVRRMVLWLVSKNQFDYFVILLIGLNAVLMALEDPLRDEENPTKLEKDIETAELIFVRIYPPARSLSPGS